MIFSLDVRRARKGDCLIVHYGTNTDPGLIVIDGGPAQVYEPHLKPRLSAIRDARGIASSDPLPVDLLMVSHIDDDHINGILELTGELVRAKQARQPQRVKVRKFWHNTFDDIIGNNPEELRKAVTAAFGAAALAGDPDVEGLDPAAAKVLASLGQGIRLRDDARNLALRVNPDFEGRLVMADDNAAPIDMGKGLSFIVAGPMQPELVRLQKEHDAFLKKQESEKRSRGALASFTDTSIPNLSSIVVIAEAGGKRMLLTGDARGDKILEGLELVGELTSTGTIHVDLLKMPHHGSDRNMETRFLERVVADHYVFSGDGEHGNPERGTLEMLLEARGDDDYTIHLTYPIDEIDPERKRDWENEQKKERARKKKNPQAAVEIRADWSDEKNSLKAFFDANPAIATKVRIVDQNQPHVINLLDPLGL
jgi:hypothetical protein